MKTVISPVRTKDTFLFLLVVTVIAIVFSIQKTFDWRGKANGTAANIIVDSATAGEEIDTSFYHAFAQGGAENGDMLAPVSQLVKKLNPTLIRIDHIYDGYDVVLNGPNGVSFDWTKLDRVVDTIVSTGAIPLLSLSYMPPSVAIGGSVINAPVDWGIWQQMVSETIRHYSGAKGIGGVRYEVWNEPDLAQFGGWKYYGDKNYMTMYMYASNAATRVTGVRPFYLGGPATTSYYDAWIQSVLASGNRVDFVSWHVYDSDPKTIATHMGKFTALLRSHTSFGTVPVYITEFGHTGDKSALYASKYEAVHLAATVRQLADVLIKPVLFSFQLKDGKNDDAQGWGMITHEEKGATIKPRYSAYVFLDSMKGKRLSVSGEGSWVTGLATVNGDTRRLLLMNIDPQIAGGSHVETVPVSFAHLPPGEYTMKRRRFLEKTVTSSFVASGESIGFSVYMPANSMEIIEIAPKNT